MTAREKTCTDHLHDALAALDKANPSAAGSALHLQAAYEAVEAALRVIQTARCEAMTAIDKF